MHLLYVVNVSHAFGVPRKSYTKDTKGRKGKRELIMICLGCSKLSKSDTYKGTEGVTFFKKTIIESKISISNFK
jgi:hypothetical protein